MLLSHWGEYASECAYERKYLTIAQTSPRSQVIRHVLTKICHFMLLSHGEYAIAIMLSEGHI